MTAHRAARFWFLPLLISLVLPLVGPGPVLGQNVIAWYPFTPKQDNDMRTGPGYVFADPDVIATDVSLSDSIPHPPASEPFYISFFDPPYDTRVLRLEPGPDSTDADQAVKNNKYFEFTIMAAPDLSLDLDFLIFEAARGGGSTPRGWVLRSSVDGFTNNIATELVETQRPELSLFFVDLTDPQFQDLSEVTFRIYTFVPLGGQSLEYRNVLLFGSVVQ
jgi:hypothetical protein